MNFVIEAYSAFLCLVGALTLAILLPRSNSRTFVSCLYACGFLMCAGDAMAGLGRGQQGDLAWLAVHVGNFLALASPQMALACYASRLSQLFGRGSKQLVWWGRIAWIIVICVIFFIACGGAYTIDDNNIYSRNPGFWVLGMTGFLLSGVNLVVLVINRRSVKNRTFTVYAIFSTLPLFASVFQPFVYGLNVPVVIYLLCLVAVFCDSAATAAERASMTRARALIRDKKAAEKRLTDVASQIRPDYLFNKLDEINSLVKEDPDRAQEEIDHLSLYLRDNLDPLNQVGAVPIDKDNQIQ